MLSLRMFLAAAAVVLPLNALAQQSATPPLDRQPSNEPITTALQINSVVTGFVKDTQGRIFLVLSHIDGSTGPQVVEWLGGKPVPFPSAAWNGWKQGDDPANRFVRANALRTGPHGALWIVDIGAPEIGQLKLPNGPKIVEIDLSTNKVVRIFPLDGVTNPKSAIDDIRFHDGLAYITDAGSPGLIVLDIATGAARRVLDGDPSVTAQRPVMTGEHVLRGPDDKPVKIHADQLEVSPDGKFLYYQPASGPMSRVATRYLDDAKLTETQLAKHVTTFSKTGSTGGTAIDVDGTIYCSDADKHRILTIDPDGHQKQLVEDPRLLWVDAMWIDSEGYLYMPAAQLDRMAPFNGGTSKLQLPISVYKMKIGVKPPPSDHP